MPSFWLRQQSGEVPVRHLDMTHHRNQTTKVFCCSQHWLPWICYETKEMLWLSIPNFVKCNTAAFDPYTVHCTWGKQKKTWYQFLWLFLLFSLYKCHLMHISLTINQSQVLTFQRGEREAKKLMNPLSTDCASQVLRSH